LCVDEHSDALVTSLDDPKQSSETTPVPVVDSSLTESTLVHSAVPTISPLPIPGEDVQQSIVSAVSELASSKSDTSSTVSAVTDGGDKQLLAMPPAMTIPIAETSANGTMSSVSENFFCKRLPVPKRQRSATKPGRAHLVSFALTSSAHLADVEAREAKRSKEKAAPKKMPKLKSSEKCAGGHPKQTKKSQKKVQTKTSQK